jgi:hypothetical protein
MERHTFSVKPHERASCLPFLVDITLSEPSCRALMMRITGDVVVYRRIRRRKPLSDGFLQLGTCDEVLASETHDDNAKRNKRFDLYTLSTSSCSLTLPIISNTQVHP